MTHELRHDGHLVNHKRVERLMRCHGIVGHRPRRRRSLTKPDAGAVPAGDLIGRLFDPDRPDVAWCGDITNIPTGEGWLYLASTIDLASRRLIGWSMGRPPRCPARRRRARRRRRLSRPTVDGPHGSCLYDAVAESWFATLKVELVDRRRFATSAEARTAIFRWIAWYNHRRLHSTNDYLPPVEWEHRHTTTDPIASPMAA